MRVLNKTLILDVDDTLLDFNKAFHAWMAEQGYRRRYNVDTYDLAASYGISLDTFRGLLHLFFDDDAGRDIPAVEHAVVALYRFHRAGWNMVAVTACPPILTTVRALNLERRFPNNWSGDNLIERVHCVGWGGSKAEIICDYRDMSRRTIFVEDHLENAEAAVNLGVPTFLIDKPYNQGKTNGYIRVGGWPDILERMLLKECVE
jgi:FMN phosphatase YigB (HAD superfamily)